MIDINIEMIPITTSSSISVNPPAARRFFTMSLPMTTHPLFVFACVMHVAIIQSSPIADKSLTTLCPVQQQRGQIAGIDIAVTANVTIGRANSPPVAGHFGEVLEVDPVITA